MESEYRKGYVYIQSHFAGIIAETEEGYTFAYDKDYLNREDAVAVSWLLGVVSRNWKISQKDRFGLLLSACRDCIGDVSIRKERA